MSAIPIPITENVYSPYRSAGVSDEARHIGSRAAWTRGHLANSASFSTGSVVGEIYELVREIGSGWDDQAAIEDATVANAHRFLQSLPLGLELPTVGVEPDGFITLEWYRSPKRLVNISIGPGDTVYFVAFYDTAKSRGSFDLAIDGVQCIARLAGRVVD